MADVDPLSEVYQGRDNTGAAYIIPSSKIRASDLFVQEMRQRQAKSNALKDTWGNLADLDKQSRWERDTPELQAARDQYLTKVATYSKAGVDPLRHPEVHAELAGDRDKMLHMAMGSLASKELYNEAVKTVVTAKDGDIANPQDALAKIEEWAKRPVATKLRVNPMTFIQKTPDINYIEAIDKAMSGKKYEIKNESYNKGQVSDPNSPTYETYKSTKFDEAAARQDAPEILDILKPGQRRQLYTHAVDELTSQLAQQGQDFNALPDAQKSALLREHEIQMVVNNAKVRVTGDSGVVPHYKPTGDQGAGDGTTGNDRFAWAGQDIIRLNTPKLSVNDPNDKAIRAALAIPTAVPITDETIAFYGDKAKSDPLYKAKGGNNTSKKVDAALDLYKNGEKKSATVIKTYPIQNLNPAENSPHDWTFTGEEGTEKTVKGSIKSIDKVLDNKTNKVSYVAEIIVPAHKEGKNDVPQHIVQAPYTELESQIETYTRGKKNKPGFNLRNMESDYTSPTAAPKTSQVTDSGSAQEFTVGGVKYRIPKNKVAAFKKAKGI